MLYAYPPPHVLLSRVTKYVIINMLKNNIFLSLTLYIYIYRYNNFY